MNQTLYFKRRAIRHYDKILASGNNIVSSNTENRELLVKCDKGISHNESFSLEKLDDFVYSGTNNDLMNMTCPRIHVLIYCTHFCKKINRKT